VPETAPLHDPPQTPDFYNLFYFRPLYIPPLPPLHCCWVPGFWVREPTVGVYIIYLQTGMETEPSGTHELYLRKSGFRHTDGSRLEHSTPARGVIFGKISPKKSPKEGVPFCPIFKFVKIRCPEMRNPLPKEISLKKRRGNKNTLRDSRARALEESTGRRGVNG
jgi:hypothetical protein